MRKISGIVCGLAGLTAFSALPAARADKPVSIEKELLGIRVLQTYKQVLAKYGAPTYIFKQGEALLLLDARNLKGDITGGVIGIDNGGSGAGNSGGGTQANSGGFAGKGGGSGAGPPGSFGGGGQRGGGAPGSFGRGGGPPGSFGGGQGAPTAAGASGAGSSGAGGGGSQAGSEQTFGEAGGYYWVYHYPKQELAYVFVFNHDGRIEAIFERGRLGGQRTVRGVGLGDSVESVYRAYGWTDGIKEERDRMISFYYNDKYHAQFVTVKNKVIGIVVALRETQKLGFLDNANGGGGGGGRSSGARGGSSGGGSNGPGSNGPVKSGASGGPGGVNGKD